eukprot:631885-Pleurochrysis_carterae.AAC.1
MLYSLRLLAVPCPGSSAILKVKQLVDLAMFKGQIQPKYLNTCEPGVRRRGTVWTAGSTESCWDGLKTYENRIASVTGCHLHFCACLRVLNAFTRHSSPF